MGNCFSVRIQSAATPPNSGNEPHGGKTANEAVLRKSQAEQRSFHARSTLPASSGSAPELHPFSYADLRTATRNFRPDSFLGEGGFGSVFKGHIDERTFAPTKPNQGLVIAVKKLNPEGLQGHQEWLAELYFLGALRHRNLVKLIGYCYEEEHRLLVYEFLSRGSLENQLFGRSRQSLPWNTRLKIASDAARGLAFLHDAPKPVIYRDFKTSNILLDGEFNAKLSDFGLAKDGPTGDKTHVTTRVMGTYGYAAPEYVATGRLTAKSDVYGFGVVLLEILTGRRAVDKDKFGVEQNLVEWAMPYLEDKRNKWSRILDQRLDGQYSLKGFQIAASLAVQCLNQDAKLRPTMKQVLESLEPLLGPKDFSKPSYPNTSTSSKPLSKPLALKLTQGQNFDFPTPKQDHESMPPFPKQEYKPVDPREPVSAFRLPSPKPSSIRQGNNNAFPSPSPTRSPRPQKKHL